MPNDYKVLTIPFGREATPDMINDIPDYPNPTDPNAASWEQGFPYVTTIPLAAGGLPPQGQDFNGVLRDITQHIVHQNKGGMYKFNDIIVSAGGYPKGSILLSDDGLTLYVSVIDENKVNFNTGEYSGSWIAIAGVDAFDLTEGSKSYKMKIIKGSLALVEVLK